MSHASCRACPCVLVGSQDEKLRHECLLSGSLGSSLIVPWLQIVSEASGRSKTNLLKPLLEKMQPPLEKRRLMPLKHAAAQIGNAAAFTLCLQQRPCLLPLSQVRSPAPLRVWSENMGDSQTILIPRGVAEQSA